MSEKVLMRRMMVVLLLAAALGLGACAGKRAKPEATPAAGTENAAGAEGAGAHNAKAANAGADDEAAGPQGGLLVKRIVYFDFDSAEIKGEGTDIVAAHAKYLAGHTGTRVRLEGHTDDRGSRDYNIGLGERRAQAVRRALLLQGAADAQI